MDIKPAPDRNDGPVLSDISSGDNSRDFFCMLAALAGVLGAAAAGSGELIAGTDWLLQLAAVALPGLTARVISSLLFLNADNRTEASLTGAAPSLRLFGTVPGAVPLFPADSGSASPVGSAI